MNLKDKFEKKYGKKYTRSKCKEKNCGLNDISKNKYFIINGDKIKSADEKSVDCIIIDLNKNENKKYKVILCELTSGDKNLKDAVDKFKASGKLIINNLNKINESIYQIDCLLLGTIVKNGKTR